MDISVKQLLMLVALVAATVVFSVLNKKSERRSEHYLVWNVLLLSFVVFSKLGGLIYAHEDLTLEHWKTSGVLLLCGVVPAAFFGLLYAQMRGGVVANASFLANAVVGLAIGQFVGRIGCVFDQCCYGPTCGENALFYFYNDALGTYTLDVVLLELLVLAGFLISAFVLKRRPIVVAALYLVLNGVFRWITDPVRLDVQPRGLFADWGHGQELSLFLLVLSVWLVISSVIERRR